MARAWAQHGASRGVMPSSRLNVHSQNSCIRVSSSMPVLTRLAGDLGIRRESAGSFGLSIRVEQEETDLLRLFDVARVELIDGLEVFESLGACARWVPVCAHTEDRQCCGFEVHPRSDERIGLKRVATITVSLFRDSSTFFWFSHGAIQKRWITGSCNRRCRDVTLGKLAMGEDSVPAKRGDRAVSRSGPWAGSCGLGVGNVERGRRGRR